MTDGDDILQFRFKDRVEVFRGADGDDGVGVGETGEDTDSGKRELVNFWCGNFGDSKDCDG